MNEIAIMIPFQRSQKPKPPTQVPVEADTTCETDISGYTILVVERMPVTGSRLRLSRAQIDVAGSGQEAIQLWSGYSPGYFDAILVDGEQVTLMRVGEFNSQMVFQEGRRHLSMYNTPYGAMTIGVNTRHLLAKLTDQGGDIEVDYAVEVDHALAGRNIFRINVREAEGGMGSLKQ